MKYSIFIKPIKDESTLKMFARRVASEQDAVGYKTILNSLATKGIIYLKDLDKDRVVEKGEELSKLGLQFSIIKGAEEPVRKAEPKPKESKPSVIVSKSPSAPMVPKKIDHKGDSIYSSSKNTTSKKGADKSSSLKTYLILATILLVVGFMLYKLSHKKDFTIKENKSTVSLKGKSGSSKKADASSKKLKGKSNNRKDESSKRNASAQEIDSVISDAQEACGNNGSEAVKLYRVALSFNKNNLNAWYGMLNCYLEHNQKQEADSVREEIKRIFGNDVFSVAALILPYGDLGNYSSNNREFRASYKSFSKDRDAITQQIFNICRGVYATEEFDKAVIFAETSSGKGVLVSVELSPFPETIVQFRAVADISVM